MSSRAEGSTDAGPDGPDAGSSPAEVTWVGHGCVLLEMDGVRVLGDPLLTRRVGHLRRRASPTRAEVRRADLVLISHGHADHLHRRSLRLVAEASPGAVVVAPRGAGAFVPDGFADVREVDVGDRLLVAGVGVEVVEADHSPHRGRWDRRWTGAVGYVVARAGRRAYLAGDTDLFEAMAGLGRIDLAAIPISGWWKKLGPGHLDATSAAEAVRRVDPVRVLPIHWGTYAPEDLGTGIPDWFVAAGREFTAALADLGLEGRLVRLEPGETAVW